MAYTLEYLAKQVNGDVIGDATCQISSVATLTHAQAGQISFLTNVAYKDQLQKTKASAVILSRDNAALCPVAALVVKNPHAAYARIAQLLNPEPATPPGVHPTAWVDPSAQLDPSVSIGPGTVVEAEAVIANNVVIGPRCVIGRGAKLGEGTRLVASVTLCHQVIIGKRVLIHPGAVIGSDGFGHAYDKGQWVKVPQLGSVRVGDDVEIGAGTTIDRGTIDDTVIEEGVRLDNLIQIAHNVHLGAHTIIASGTGIAGSTRIGRHCVIAGAVGIAGHLTITDGVTITGMSMVIKDITEPGSYSSGVPVDESQQWHRTYIRIKQLDELSRRVRALEKQQQK